MHVLRGVACTAICMICAVCIIYGFGALTISPKTGNYGYHSWLVFVFTVTSILWKIDFFTKHTLQFYGKLIILLNTHTQKYNENFALLEAWEYTANKLMNE